MQRGDRVCEHNKCVDPENSDAVVPPTRVALAGFLRTPARASALAAISTMLPGALLAGFTELADEPRARIGMMISATPFLALGVPLAHAGIQQTRKTWLAGDNKKAMSRRTRAAWWVVWAGFCWSGFGLCHIARRSS